MSGDNDLTPFGISRRALLRGAAGGAGALLLGDGLLPILAEAARRPAGVAEFTLDVEVGAFSPMRRSGASAARSGWVVTEPLAPGRRFDLLGLRWQAPASAVVEVRARRRGESWSNWKQLPLAGEHAPDGVRPDLGTEPIWVGGADLLQLRVSRRLRGLRLHFVNSTRAAAPAGRSRASRDRSADASQAGAGAPAIVPRAAWGGDGCRPRRQPSYGQVQLAFIHHTVSLNDYGPEESAAMVLAICHYHRNTNGWDDIGYNLLVDRFGQVFEGRAGGVDQAVIGAHAQGYNGVSTGIAVLGSHGTEPLTSAAFDTLAHVVGWKLAAHGAPAEGQVTVESAGGAMNRYPKGQLVTFERVAGHSDADTTECPGAALHAQLPELRASAARYASGAAQAPARSAAVVRAEPRRVTVGESAIVDGSVPDGRTARLVVLRRRRGRYRRVQTRAITPRNGGFRLRVRPRHPGLYRVRLELNGHGSGAHPTTYIRVRPSQSRGTGGAPA